MNYFLLFLFGIAIGSFINVLALRYDSEKRIFRKEIIGGRSRCMSCSKTLSWYELIPLVSFLVQLGKCRSCGARLSLQYPLVELLGGAIALGVPIAIRYAYGADFYRVGEALPLWYYGASAIFILAGFTYLFFSAVDARLTIIPDQSNILIVFLGGLKIWLVSSTPIWSNISGSFIGHYAALFALRESIIVNHLVAGVFGLLFFGLIWGLSRGRAMGFGDVKLAGATGILLGWPDTILALLLAFIVGALYGILLIVRRMKTMKSGVPFGPFIAIGAALTVFFGKYIMDFYFTLFP